MVTELPIYWEGDRAMSVEFVGKKGKVVVVRMFDIQNGWENVYYEYKRPDFPKFDGNVKKFYHKVVKYLRKELIW